MTQVILPLEERNLNDSRLGQTHQEKLFYHKMARRKVL